MPIRVHSWLNSFSYRLSRFGPMICLLPVLMILAAPSAFAHDPGLSAAEVKLDGNKVVARLTFARGDIAVIAPMDADRDGRITQQEFDAARGRLESLAKESFALGVAGEDLSPRAVAVGIDESGAIHFDLEFPLPQVSRLTLRSLLIDKLPRGHRQFLALRDAKGNIQAQRMLDAANNSFELNLTALQISQTRPHAFWGFLPLGVEHILLGFDHLAFLFALLIAGGTVREAAKIITSFTVAHSITLALATLEVIVVPASVVEPMIAASIIYVGLENILRREIERRWLLTFAFGLIHGFGFASALRDLGVGAGVKAVAPLLSFNLGVEIGQVAVAALVLPLIWKLRQRPRFVVRYVPACSILVALAGGYWLIERTILK
ncbi:MAG TPA: HupE/UreJ family protein [Blastocatellia bacterium]|nr:HupE/UreJ family protein [Blastocatellia bacterium]